MKIRCLNCMKEYEKEDGICLHCGYIEGATPQETYHLHPGMELNGKYIVGTVIGFGGFGIIYKAWDKNLEKVVAIKEYYPTAFLNRVPGKKTVDVYDKKKTADFEKGKNEFLEEARTLAKFNNHPNIVHVYDFFEENGTAYFTMEFLSGYNLKTYLQRNKKEGKKISVETALQITQCILNALKSIHGANIIHRDIKPANIFICDDGTIKLIDLGAARFSDNETEKTRTIIITPGYAPAEQYQIKSKQGSYTDIYAVAAVLYEMLTGIKPDESINRKVEDTVEDPRKINPDVSETVNAAVMRAMAVQAEIRFQNVEQFARALSSGKKVRDAKKEIKYRKNRRNVRIAILVMMIIAAGALCFIQFQRIKKEAILEPAVLDIWIPYGEEGGEAAKALVNNMSSEFLTNNEMIQMEITAIAEEDYEEELKNALASGEAPDIFDSSCFDSKDYGKLADLNKLFEFDLFEPDKYYFLEQYHTYFPSAKQLPLTVNVPILYENTISEEQSNIELEQIKANTYAQFAEQTVDRYLGTVEDYSNVQRDLSGIYKLSYLEATESEQGEFTDLWSINASASEAEYAAAIRLLYYFLSETSQDYLTVQNDNNLPLNRNILDIYMDVNNDFSGVDSLLLTIEMKGENVIK